MCTPHCWWHLVLVQPLPTIHIFYQSLEKNALIWDYFQNIWQCRFWGHGGQSTFEVDLSKLSKFWFICLFYLVQPLPTIYILHQSLEKNALIWGYLQNIWQCRFWGHGGQSTFEVDFSKLSKFWFICLFYFSSKVLLQCKRSDRKDK